MQVLPVGVHETSIMKQCTMTLHGAWFTHPSIGSLRSNLNFDLAAEKRHVLLNSQLPALAAPERARASMAMSAHRVCMLNLRHKLQVINTRATDALQTACIPHTNLQPQGASPERSTDARSLHSSKAPMLSILHGFICVRI